MSLRLPSDFAKKIAETFNWKLVTVEEFFDVSEDKDGYFWAKLKAKKFLDKPDFVTLCRLTKDLGGEGYLQGARAWKIAGPFAKKATTSQPSSTPQSIPASVPKTSPKQPSPEISQSSALAISALSEDEDVQSLRGSSKKIGSLYPVLIDADNNVIDGFHRLKADPNWPKYKVDSVQDPVQLAKARLIANERRNVPPEEKTQLLREIVSFTGWDVKRLAEELGWKERTVYLYLPSDLKGEEPKQFASARLALGMDKTVSSATLKPQDMTVGKARELLESPAGKEVLEEAIKERQGQPVEEDENEVLYADGMKLEPEKTRESIPKMHEPGKESVPSPTVKPRLKSEEIDTGFAWECPECQQKFRLIHVKRGDGKIEHRLEA